jgi:hypothetical protein
MAQILPHHLKFKALSLAGSSHLLHYFPTTIIIELAKLSLRWPNNPYSMVKRVVQSPQPLPLTCRSLILSLSYEISYESGEAKGKTKKRHFGWLKN